MSRPTMEDVKNLAGVSISTVSRVINGTKKVSPEKTLAVERAIEQLGYKPNEVARSLVMKKSNTIGIILDDIGIEYMAQIVRGIDEVGKMYKYDILLYSTFGDLEVQRNAVEFLSSKQVEGIIVISEGINSEIVYKIKENQIPYIQLDPYFNSNEITTVGIDYNKAMSEMTEKFIENGHKKVLYLRERSKSDSSFLMQTGYEEVMDSSGLDREVVTVNDTSVDSAYEFMEKHMDYIHERGITAIITSNDRLAIGVINYCYDNGLIVPDDLSVSGFGNYEISNLYRPRLTTIRLPYYDIGAISIRVLIKHLAEDEKFDKSINLNYEIVERESTTTNLSK